MLWQVVNTVVMYTYHHPLILVALWIGWFLFTILSNPRGKHSVH